MDGKVKKNQARAATPRTSTPRAVIGSASCQLICARVTANRSTGNVKRLYLTVKVVNQQYTQIKSSHIYIVRNLHIFKTNVSGVQLIS